MEKVYIAGSLVHVPKERWVFYEEIGDVVKSVGLVPHIPHIHTARGLDPKGFELDPVKVFNTNMGVVRESKLIIADVTNRSTGTGIEIGAALELKKPIIALSKETTRVSKMVTGPAKSGAIDLIIYKTEEEGLERLREVLKNKLEGFHERTDQTRR